jgi:RNA polymerase primary sigma factor
MVVAFERRLEVASSPATLPLHVEQVDEEHYTLADDAGVSSMAAYARQAMRVPLLTAEMECYLARTCEEAKEAAGQLAADISPERRAELQAIVGAGEIARKRLIEANLRLVMKIARLRFQRGCPGLTVLDLVQEGNVGLMQATDRYDWRLGYRFSTYAIWWIRREIERAVSEQGRSVRVPLHVRDEMSKLSQVEARVTATLGRQPTREELARAAGMSEKKVEELQLHVQPVLSLDQTTHDDTDFCVGDTLADPSASEEMEQVPERAKTEAIDRVLALLSPRERQLICLRFGFEDGEPRTLDEVGAILGVSRERARQLETKALTRLRGYCRTSELRDFVYA